MASLGERIRQIRKLKNMSQVELEKKIGIKREYLSKIENSELRNPTYSTLQKIAHGLGVPLAELVELEREPALRLEPRLRVVTLEEKSKARLSARQEEFVAVPVVSHEAAIRGPGYLSERQVQEYMLLSTKYLPTSEVNRYRGVRLAEDDYSMWPVIGPGALVGVDFLQRGVKDTCGRLVLVRLNSKTCSVRRLQEERGYLICVPENLRDYNPFVVTGSKREVILGQVVWALNFF